MVYFYCYLFIHRTNIKLARILRSSETWACLRSKRFGLLGVLPVEKLKESQSWEWRSGKLHSLSLLLVKKVKNSQMALVSLKKFQKKFSVNRDRIFVNYNDNISLCTCVALTNDIHVHVHVWAFPPLLLTIDLKGKEVAVISIMIADLV